MHIPATVRHGVAAMLFVTIAGAVVWSVASRPERGSEQPAARSAKPDAIACLGKIGPEDGVVRLSARSISGQPSIVAELLVKEGDSVRR